MNIRTIINMYLLATLGLACSVFAGSQEGADKEELQERQEIIAGSSGQTSLSTIPENTLAAFMKLVPDDAQRTTFETVIRGAYTQGTQVGFNAGRAAESETMLLQCMEQISPLAIKMGEMLEGLSRNDSEVERLRSNWDELNHAAGQYGERVNQQDTKISEVTEAQKRFDDAYGTVVGEHTRQLNELMDVTLKQLLAALEKTDETVGGHTTSLATLSTALSGFDTRLKICEGDTWSKFAKRMFAKALGFNSEEQLDQVHISYLAAAFGLLEGAHFGLAHVAPRLVPPLVPRVLVTVPLMPVRKVVRTLELMLGLYIFSRGMTLAHAKTNDAIKMANDLCEYLGFGNIVTFARTCDAVLTQCGMDTLKSRAVGTAAFATAVTTLAVMHRYGLIQKMMQRRARK